LREKEEALIFISYYVDKNAIPHFLKEDNQPFLSCSVIIEEECNKHCFYNYRHLGPENQEGLGPALIRRPKQRINKVPIGKAEP